MIVVLTLSCRHVAVRPSRDMRPPIAHSVGAVGFYSKTTRGKYSDTTQFG
jgi:hypothetical protein